MAGTTPRGFPYPTGTDRVTDGDNAIEALARSIDTYFGGQTTEGAISYGTSVGNAGDSKVIRTGRTVHLTLTLVTSAMLGTGHILCGVPTGFMPPATWNFLVKASGGQAFYVYIETNGQVKVSEPVNATVNLWGSVSFPASSLAPTLLPTDEEGGTDDE